ncbi:bifunctional indole-3-glycerol-phosphate synthase TrpC/phosphoribosylanthranilate isomerase TrpF [Thalassotalea ponticola]|uniref:bifunctional indole-3-glycerol-phosphate synthase TrpC/phosphoribosylanthranilate isomerase TrpF n=1 Tax=Thalassotalea ponticola TaxID=1523392 RepID=UPI0025B62244|nr:bifunctional indole-3-glycerol-phosphate synthase TrpC/phosphoribosylanthranilate isomerase TrpF [Thalassotalea ponticola]MDN3653197.1 bifunctional indole-3-glycerol-phosphate synthase TrpC/phosphoribosylanthranilate isomerase TrpF [Thalassotalea ponticola]
MANILQNIIAHKRVEIDQLKQRQPLASLLDSITPTTRDMYAVLAQPGCHFILECKKASPSKGLIRADFNPQAIARVYDKYASAISVLTEQRFFQGSFQYLRQVRQVVDCPILNKDFFIDAYQVHLARYHGADAILLMLSVLTDEQYCALAKVAEDYNMAILTEVSTVAETERAIALGARLIGINNRNLRDLTTDTTRTFDLASLIPSDRMIISESGINDNKQLRALASVANGFLIGSSLMAQNDIDFACRQLIYGDHKVCGMTRSEDIVHAIGAGATSVGMIFVDSSPRCISLQKAQQLQAEVAFQCDHQVRYIAVFKDHSIDVVVEHCQLLNLWAVQLHGREDQHYIAQLRQQLASKIKIIKALAVDACIPQAVVGSDMYLLDNKQPGSGQAFDWSLTHHIQQLNAPVMLAGGIDSHNVKDAIALLLQTDMLGLDINSGVELCAGVKDKHKLQQLFTLLRQYN